MSSVSGGEPTPIILGTVVADEQRLERLTSLSSEDIYLNDVELQVEGV